MKVGVLVERTDGIDNLKEIVVSGMSKSSIKFIGGRASEASETLSGVYKFELVRYMYVWRYVCNNSSAYHVYVMWVSLCST